MAMIRNARAPLPPDPKYAGKHDYQGNHEVFEMPESQKPPGRSMPKLPLNKIALGIILAGIVLLIVLAAISIVQQSI